MHELEEELGQRLFSQVGRQLRLTPAGQRLRQRAEEMLALAQQTRSELLSLGDELSGEVFIGAGESSAMREVAERIAAFRQRYPKIRFHRYSGNAEEILSRLDHGLLDFGVLIQPVDIARYESRPLAERATWGLILRRDHPLAAKRAICRADLPGLPLLCPRPMLASASVRNPCLDWLDGKTEALTIVGSYNLLYNAAQLVETGTVCAIGLDHLLGNQPAHRSFIARQTVSVAHPHAAQADCANFHRRPPGAQTPPRHLRPRKRRSHPTTTPFAGRKLPRAHRRPARQHAPQHCPAGNTPRPHLNLRSHLNLLRHPRVLDRPSARPKGIKSAAIIEAAPQPRPILPCYPSQCPAGIAHVPLHRPPTAPTRRFGKVQKCTNA